MSKEKDFINYGIMYQTHKEDKREISNFNENHKNKQIKLHAGKNGLYVDVKKKKGKIKNDKILLKSKNFIYGKSLLDKLEIYESPKLFCEKSLSGILFVSKMVGISHADMTNLRFNHIF